MQSAASSHISQCLAPHGAFDHQLMAAYERLPQYDPAEEQDVVDLEPFEIEEFTDPGTGSKSASTYRKILRPIIAGLIALNVILGTIALLMMLFGVRSRSSWDGLRDTWVYSNCFALAVLFVIAVIVGSYRLAKRFI